MAAQLSGVLLVVAQMGSANESLLDFVRACLLVCVQLNSQRGFAAPRKEVGINFSTLVECWAGGLSPAELWCDTLQWGQGGCWRTCSDRCAARSRLARVIFLSVRSEAVQPGEPQQITETRDLLTCGP